jgi:hypothetical protein
MEKRKRSCEGRWDDQLVCGRFCEMIDKPDWFGSKGCFIWGKWNNI